MGIVALLPDCSWLDYMNVAPIARERSFVLGVTEDHDHRNLVRAARQRLPIHAIEERLIRHVRSGLKREVRRLGPKRVVRDEPSIKPELRDRCDFSERRNQVGLSRSERAKLMAQEIRSFSHARLCAPRSTRASVHVDVNPSALFPLTAQTKYGMVEAEVTGSRFIRRRSVPLNIAVKHWIEARFDSRVF
jgi:hypothetical protein